MDNIVKLNAQQALFNANNRLVDLVIPGNSGVYNLSECYVAIDMSVDGLTPDLGGMAGQLANVPGNALGSASAVADVRLGIKHLPDAAGVSIYDQCAVPVETLVRNASMFSATRGKVEDIRRVDALKATMKAYTQDVEDVESASLIGMPPPGKSNPWSSGRFAALVGVGDTTSEYKTRELRIMLKDLFNIAEAEAWDTSIYGDTHIHLELNLNRTELQQNLTSPLASGVWNRYYHNQQVGTIHQPANNKYKQALQQSIAPSGAADRTFDTITMLAQYDSLEDSPFWVNQILQVKTDYTAIGTATVLPADASVNWAVIKSISWDKTTKRITLDFGAGSEILKVTGAITTNPLLIDREVAGLPMTAASMAAGLTFQGVELTAVRRPEMDRGPEQIQYTQFLTTSDQWQNASSLNRSYFLPPQTTNAFMVFPSAEGTSFSDLLGCARIGDYRFTINGESVTNRVVPFLTEADAQGGANTPKCDKGSSLHYTLISEAMMNSGRRYHSLEESVYDFNIPMSTDVPVSGAGVIGWENLADAPQKLCYMLALPIPLSNEQTQLSIELEGKFGASSGNMLLYAEQRSVI